MITKILPFKLDLQQVERALGIAGLLILFWMTYRLGLHRIIENFRQINLGFFVIVCTKSVQYLFEAAAWKMILADEGKKVKFLKLLRITLEGESLNYITMTRLGGETAKILSLKEEMPLSTAAASVIVLKFSSLLGFWVVITFGFLSAFYHADIAGEFQRGFAILLLSLSCALMVVSWIQKRGMFRPLSMVLNQFQSKREWVSQHVLRLTRLDNKILETYRSKQGYITLSVLCNALGWAEEIFFIWITFHFLKIPEPWYIPTIIAATALLINSFFFFVPWRAGTQEGTMVLAFTLLSLSEPLGLSVAILRRMRELVWVFFGLILFSLKTAPVSAE